MASHIKRRDFIETISSMSDKELNDYIKTHGSPPKPVAMVRLIDIKERKEIKINE